MPSTGACVSWALMGFYSQMHFLPPYQGTGKHFRQASQEILPVLSALDCWFHLSLVFTSPTEYLLSSRPFYIEKKNVSSTLVIQTGDKKDLSLCAYKYCSMFKLCLHFWMLISNSKRFKPEEAWIYSQYLWVSALCIVSKLKWQWSEKFGTPLWFLLSMLVTLLFGLTKYGGLALQKRLILAQSLKVISVMTEGT